MFALSGAGQSKLPAKFPSLKQAQDARFIKVKEVSISHQASSSSIKISNEKEKDWLPLLLRESLGTFPQVKMMTRSLLLVVDTKYLTSSQTLEVVYEGRSRRFSVVAVDPSSKTDSSDLSDRFQTLGIDSQSSIWIANWDSVVTIVENDVSIPQKVCMKAVFSISYLTV